MAVTSQRRLHPTTTRQFGTLREHFSIPDLTKIQTESYARFLQYETPADKRKDDGLEGVLREIFPIESYDKKLTLDYLRYELGKPRYEPDECRQLRLTYGRPFRIWLYPLPCLLALAGWLFVYLTAKPVYIGMGLLTLVIGVGVYYLWQRRIGERPGERRDVSPT